MLSPRSARWLGSRLLRYLPDMTDLKTHSGGCHCGKVRFDVKIDLTAPVMACNCSICQRSGTLLSFVPGSQFQLKSGEDALTEYKFNRHHIQHLFCSTCGIRSFSRGTSKDGSPTVAINTRCLEGLEDIRKLNIQYFDGRSM